MNGYWTGFIFLVFLGCCLATYHAGQNSVEVSCQKQQEAQQQQVISAQNVALQDVNKQQIITQGVENAYHIGVSSVDDLYSASGVRRSNSTSSNLPSSGSSSGRSDVPACKSSPTRYYKLTPMECDQNTTQLINLQNWVKQQNAQK